MAFSFSSASLTSPVTRVEKIKYFPIELYCANMVPGMVYNVYFDGILVNAFCKPYGGNLGDPIKADSTGKLTVLFLLSSQYKTQHLVAGTPENNMLNVSKKIEFVSPYGVSSVTYIPMVLKAG